MNSEELKNHCMKVLSEVGASDEYTKFFVDVVQTESEIDEKVHIMHQKLAPPEDDPQSANPTELLATIQELTKSYHNWKGDIDKLATRGKELPPLNIDPKRINQSQSLKMLCNIQTKDLKLAAGDELKVIDTTQPNKLKVRTRAGQEGYIPALSCLLPSPDKNAISAPDRVKLQLLASWRDSMNKCKGRLVACLSSTTRRLSTDWKNKSNISSSGAKERVARRLRRLSETIDSELPNWDLTKLHHVLFSLEKELDSWSLGNNAEVAPVIAIVANLDKAVLCYQMFRKQWYMYRKSLERCPRPMRIVDKVEHLRSTNTSNRNFRYYEVKVTREEVETVEEIVERKVPEDAVRAEEITTKRSEERRKFVITAVVDPRSGELVSFDDAIRARIIDPARGMYYNPNTGAGMSIPEAMNNGKIKVEHSTAEVTKEETRAVGLITIKSRIEHKHYTIKQVTNAISGKNMSLEEAKAVGLIDKSDSHYIVPGSGDKVPLEKAIEGGWVVVDNTANEEKEPEFETKTYAISGVVDQELKRRVPFADAVKRGLVNKNTGTYVNNVTGERVFVAEAIKRGFLKAQEVTDTSGLTVDLENSVVVERIERIRRNVLKSVGVINAFKKKPNRNKPLEGKKPEGEAHKLRKNTETVTEAVDKPIDVSLPAVPASQATAAAPIVSTATVASPTSSTSSPTSPTTSSISNTASQPSTPTSPVKPPLPPKPKLPPRPFSTPTTPTSPTSTKTQSSLKQKSAEAQQEQPKEAPSDVNGKIQFGTTDKVVEANGIVKAKANGTATVSEVTATQQVEEHAAKPSKPALPPKPEHLVGVNPSGQKPSSPTSPDKPVFPVKQAVSPTDSSVDNSASKGAEKPIVAPKPKKSKSKKKKGKFFNW